MEKQENRQIQNCRVQIEKGKRKKEKGKRKNKKGGADKMNGRIGNKVRMQNVFYQST